MAEGGVDDRARQLMLMALQQAETALQVGEVPVGCVIVRPPGMQPGGTAAASGTAADVQVPELNGDASAALGEVVAVGHNETNMTCNATRHAELVAIDRALAAGTSVQGCDLFVTCEPCIMCAAALARVQIGRVYFGCHNDRFGGCGSIVSAHQGSHLGPGAHTYSVITGLHKEEAVGLFRKFYARENGKGE